MTIEPKHRPDSNLLGDMGFLVEQLLAEGPFLLALLDPKLRYVRVSQRLAAILGGEVDDFTGKSVLKFGFTKKQKTLMQQALDQNQTTVLKDWTATMSGQKTKVPGYWQWTMVPLHDQQGQIYGLYLSGKDVTDRRLLEMEVIEAAVRERREVSQTIHDHMGQLLAAMTMKAKVLEFKLDDQQLFGAEEARELQTLAAEVITTQRTVAKLLYPLEVEVGGLVNAIGNLVDETTELYGVSCSLMTPDDEPRCESVQAVHMYAILKGILQHAVKQAGAKALTVEFRLEPESYVFSVAHNGKGYKRTSIIKGYRMMTFHAHTIGGQLRVENRHGQAVTFTGRFPRIMKESE